MREVLIVDAKVVTPAGGSLEATWDRIISGKTAIAKIDRFPAEAYRSMVGAIIADIKPDGAGSMTGPIVDRLLEQVGEIPDDTLLVTATTKAGIDNLEKMKRGRPFDAREMFPCSIGEKVAARLGLRGGTLNISASCASSTVAVAEAAHLIASGRVESALVCCVEVMTEFIFSGFSALQVLSPFPCRPFDRERSGLSPGEGAACLLLMSADRARRQRRHSKCTVAGSGMSNDAFHITAPDMRGGGLMRAVRGALRTAGIEKNDIAGISAHGTGTVHNDLMELTAFRSLFGRECPPLYSIKGCVGHSFGAAGGIEAAVGTVVLAEQKIPPTAGFRSPERGAEGIVSGAPREISGDYLLVTNSGFGGINAAVVLKRGGPLCT